MINNTDVNQCKKKRTQYLWNKHITASKILCMILFSCWYVSQNSLIKIIFVLDPWSNLYIFYNPGSTDSTKHPSVVADVTGTTTTAAAAETANSTQTITFNTKALQAKSILRQKFSKYHYKISKRSNEKERGFRFKKRASNRLKSNYRGWKTFMLKLFSSHLRLFF